MHLSGTTFIQQFERAKPELDAKADKLKAEIARLQEIIDTAEGQRKSLDRELETFFETHHNRARRLSESIARIESDHPRLFDK